MRAHPSLKTTCYGWIALGLAAVLLGAAPTTAQHRHAPPPFSANPGASLSVDTSDAPIQKTVSPFRLQEFSSRSDLSTADPGTLQYRPPPAFIFASGLEEGIEPTYADLSGKSDSYRFTLELLDRYIFGPPGQDVTPYVVVGDPAQSPISIDDERPTTLSGLNIAGPSIGGGVDIPLTSSFSLFIESRFNFASPNNTIYGVPGNPPLGDLSGTALGSGLGLGSFQNTTSGSNTTSGMQINSASNFSYGWAALGLAALLFGTVPSAAQSMPADTPFFAKLGMGFSDYTGDRPIQNTGYPVDLQEFIRGNGFPFSSSSELGYQISATYAVALGLQIGNYPLARRSNKFHGSLYTAQLLGRYTFSDLSKNLDPYVDGGLNITLGGVKTGYGPTVGGGVAIPLSRSLSVFVESRFNFTLPDEAVDGRKNIGDLPPNDKTNNPKGSITGPFDSVNQLLGFGVKINFGGDSEDAPSDNSTSSNTSSPPAEKTPSPNATNPHPDTSQHKESIKVPSGTFIMGLASQDPLSLQSAGRKRVTVSSFYIDQYEVTNAEYREFLSQLSPDQRKEMMPDSTAWEKARMQENWEVYFRSDYYSNYPVLAVTWNEARAYCKAQNKRLPTEAEWEYAARGGHLGRVYPWEGMSTRDEDGDYLANFNPPEGYTADGYAFTAPVDAFPPNNWGLYNIAGNVAEWTLDAYTPSYDNISDFNPRYRDQDEPRRVVRGGAWNSDSFSIGVGVRDTQRNDEASVSVGFRCVRDVGVLDEEEKSDSSTNTQNGGQK